MADPPATKKDIEALQKQVDELKRWFQDEKALTRKRFEDEKKRTHDELDKWGPRP
jgi:hypothetical protein